ncbi:MAG TPA: hypothetical protein VJ672_12085 [Gemmatimonadaceae bacterium]|nr:hypothetical protein [Gemmatimonadaceae bacterium]
MAQPDRRRRNGVIAAVIVALFVGYLLWSTLGAQKASCEVCVSFAGGNNCATASASDTIEALQSAQSTACGPLARSMDASIACANRRPTRSRCSLR